MKFQSITLCLDMYGCPNRCKHCWLGVTPNGCMPVSELENTAAAFEPFSECINISSWYREPDYRDNYKELWEIEQRLSHNYPNPEAHYELISVWRMARDSEYIKWLAELGVKTVQLTLFGREAVTDEFTGRPGAYRDILKSIDILLSHGISPRIQTFINKRTIPELPYIEELIGTLSLEKRCSEAGGKFTFFMHQGSCDGENEQFYDDWITPDDLEKIPPYLAQHTLRHFKADNLYDVFGKTEKELCAKLLNDHTTGDKISQNPVFYIDSKFNVYPNTSTPSQFICLGNLKNDGAEAVLENYVNHKSPAAQVLTSTPFSEMVKKIGNRESLRLFSEGDYKELILNRYCRLMKN